MQNQTRKHWYVVSYDIRDPKRWRKAHQLIRGHGERVQYSLFRCRLNQTEMEALKWELEKILAEEDNLLVIHLCNRCADAIENRQSTDDWKPPARFQIV